MVAGLVGHHKAASVVGESILAGYLVSNVPGASIDAPCNAVDVPRDRVELARLGQSYRVGLGLLGFLLLALLLPALVGIVEAA